MAWKHLLSNINSDTETGDCAACGSEVSLRFRKSTGRWVCRKQDPRKSHAYTKEWIATREKFAKGQGGLCTICRGNKPLVLDHCHSTGKHRAALCTQCNSGLGMFQDNPEILVRASLYLKKHKSTDR